LSSRSTASRPHGPLRGQPPYPIADEGLMKLVAKNEKRPARRVRNLVAVKVLTVE
jgi:hypothetical protein